jgi:hypothetical protein
MRHAEDNRGHWLDDAAGPVVRPYAMTGGRVRPEAARFDLVALVAAARRGPRDAGHLQPEHRAILDAVARPVSVAETAARLNLAVAVVRVLLGDLLAEGLVTLHQPIGLALLPDEDVLKAVVNELRAR